MGLIMTDDGHVRPLRVEDLREVAERDQRIRQLEAQCAALAAQVDRQARVVDAAVNMAEHGCGLCEAKLDDAISDYKQQMAQLEQGQQA
jgi:hypothetical protein